MTLSEGDGVMVDHNAMSTVSTVELQILPFSEDAVSTCYGRA